MSAETALALSPLALFFIGWSTLAVFMAALWVVQYKTRNATLVDIGWTVGLGVLGFVYALAGSGTLQRRMLLWLLVGVWSVRLSLYLINHRILGKAEDPRYKHLRERWKDQANRNFFIFYQAQGAIAAVMSIPMLIICQNRHIDFTPLEYVAVAVWLTAILGESLADYQLSSFKRRADSKGKTCREGLWRYSRHPNYFFEWLNWCALALLAWQAPLGWLAIVSPILILYLIFKVTGIPASEAQSLVSKGDDYRDYQKTTSVFIPWPPRRMADSGASKALVEDRLS